MTSPLRVERLALRSRDPAQLAAFYRDALGFDDVAREDDAVSLALGNTRLDLETADPSAAAYPDDVPGWSPLFQHFALRVVDMTGAYARLARTTGWRPISIGGPQRLPANTGGVTAFKFRDPEGHPLELLMSPGGRSPAAIDHTAISVADVARSVAFYEALGFTVTGRSTNRGVEQDRLDALEGVVVDVVSLAPSLPSALHLELLGYRGTFDRTAMRRPRWGDVAATTIVFTTDLASSTTLQPGHGSRRDERFRDPDGHWLEVVGGSERPWPSAATIAAAQAVGPKI